ncbi:MAG TPA: hypothetical protein VHP58_04255 [Alphaproteobacteria bacterium]|nr:hypothetical protein [Alphaproteobacteria bacterium]
MNYHVMAPPEGDNLQAKHMRRARWKMAFACRYWREDGYGLVKFHVDASKVQAGPPALRLADAVWDAALAARHPKSNDLRIAEENGVAHLMDAHRDPAKAKHYHVWEGIEEWLPIRERLLGPLPLLPLEVDTLAHRNRVYEEALFRLDCRHAETGKDYLEEVTLECLKLVPGEAEVQAIDLFSKTVWWLEYWRYDGCKAHDPAKKRYLEAQTALKRFEYGHQWLANTPFGVAREILDDTFRPKR